MTICIPVEKDEGMESKVCAHFGSAPLFMILDLDNQSWRMIVNTNQHHAHGMCQPLAVIQGEAIDAMVVGGIGMGALNKLNAANIKVYISQNGTVQESVSAFKAGTLQAMGPHMACAGHGQMVKDTPKE